jgi:hypothetical protein
MSRPSIRFPTVLPSSNTQGDTASEMSQSDTFLNPQPDDVGSDEPSDQQDT